MNDQLSLFGPTISEATPNTTSSPESESGVTPYVKLDGQTVFGFGQDPVPVNRSVQAGKGKASAISVISGPHGSGSLESVALTFSLASRYRTKTASRGSTLFQLIWRERVTPSGRVIPAQRVSALRTSGSDCISWPTPNTMEGGQSSRS